MWYQEYRIILPREPPVPSLHAAVLAIHLTAVTLSGGLFFARGAAVNLFQARWPMAARVRYLSYMIDTVLLVAALTLTVVIHEYPFVQAWLTVKMLLVVVYIVLGSFALKRARSRTGRLIAFATALVVFAFIGSVAHTHNPLGIFSLL